MDRWGVRVLVGGVALLAIAAALFLLKRDATDGPGRAAPRGGAPAIDAVDPRQAPVATAPRGPQGPDDAGAVVKPPPPTNPGRMSGTARCQDGVFRDVRVTACATDDAGHVQEVLETRPGIDGKFSFTLRTPVRWRVRAEAPGWASEPWAVTLESDEVLEENLEFVPCGAIWGIVLSPDGAPAQGITVVGYERGTEYPSLPSDEHGQYRIAGPPGEYDLEAESGDWAPPYAIVQVEAGHEVRQDLRFGRGLAIRGRVTDKRGNPISGARLEATFQVPTAEVPGYLGMRQGKTGNDGSYEIPKLHDGRHVVTCRVGQVVREKLDVPAGADAVEFVIPLPGRIGGKVVRKADGKPVNRAFVTCVLPGVTDWPLARLFTGEDGAFQFPSLASGLYVLSVRAEGLETTKLEVRLTEEQVVSDLEIPLGEGWPLRGRVVSARTGAPIQGARVEIVDSGQVLTEADGRFELALASGTRTIAISHEGYADSCKQVEIRAGSTTEAEFPLTEGGAIHGRVLDAAGRPVADATVDAWNAEGHILGAATTDNEGRYEIRGLPTGTCSAKCKPGGVGLEWELHSAPVEVGEGASVEVNFAVGVGARLRGVAQRRGGPVGGVIVSVEGQGVLCRTRTGDRGEFDIVGLPPGRYEVQIQKTIYMVDVPADGVTRNFDLPAGRIVGRVVDAETGAALAGAYVVACADGASPGEEPVPHSGEDCTGPSGEFRFDGVDDGEYHLRIGATGHGTRVIGPLAVREGRTVECGDVQLGGGATIVVIVTDASGNPVPGVSFSVRAAEGGVQLGFPNLSLDPTSDAEGRFRIRYLSTGRYRGEVVAGARRASFEAGVVEGQTTEVRVTLGQ